MYLCKLINNTIKVRLYSINVCSYSGYFFIAFYYNPKIKFNREEDIVPLRRNEEQHAVGGNCSEHKLKLSMRFHKLRGASKEWGS